MKMMYNGTQIKSLNVKHYEMDTNSCDMIASDLQAGKTAVARGKKITGTGKSFEFAQYGKAKTNFPLIISSNINVIEIASIEHPIKHTIALSDMKNVDFNANQSVASVIINSIDYPIFTVISNGVLTLQCEQTINIQVFYGKDNYV